MTRGFGKSKTVFCIHYLHDCNINKIGSTDFVCLFRMPGVSVGDAVVCIKPAGRLHENALDTGVLRAQRGFT